MYSVLLVSSRWHNGQESEKSAEGWHGTVRSGRGSVRLTMSTGRASHVGRELRPLKDIVSGVAGVMGLSEDVVAQRVSSGQGRLENRVGWACLYR